MGTASSRNQYLNTEGLINHFKQVRRLTEKLCEPLCEEDYLISVTEDTSPPKWHLAHTTWFFERFILQKFKKGYEPYRPEFYFLFNSYYKHLGTFLPKNKRSYLSRPTIDEVYLYRHVINDLVDKFLHSLDYEEFHKVSKVLEIGINHEQQHQELLLMDIKRCFYENPTRPHYQNYPAYTSGEIAEATWHEFDAGLVEIGVPNNSFGFAYDIEKDRHKVWLEKFQLNSHLVTNDEYMAFIEEGGYDNPRLWLSNGWDLKEKLKWNAPLYWEKNGQEWWNMTLAGMVPVNLSAPVVHVSFYEADAFAKWKGCRLPKESEWEMAAINEFTSGDFLEDETFDPIRSREDHNKFSQIHGTVWEWTSSPFIAYPRFKSLESGLAEYNEKFMCNQFVLRGGSCLTPKTHYRPTYRNFYYPHMRWQYSGIRLAKDV